MAILQQHGLSHHANLAFAFVWSPVIISQCDSEGIFTRQAKQLLERKLKTSGEELKQLPNFVDAVSVYDPDYYDDMPDSDDIYSSY